MSDNHYLGKETAELLHKKTGDAVSFPGNVPNV